MKSCSWMLAAVLALGMALHGSASAAEGPAEDRAPAAPIAFDLGTSQCQSPSRAMNFDPVPLMFKQADDCTIPCVRDSDCIWVCPGDLAPGLCLLGCPNYPNSLRCVCVN